MVEYGYSFMVSRNFRHTHLQEVIMTKNPGDHDFIFYFLFQEDIFHDMF